MSNLSAKTKNNQITNYLSAEKITKDLNPAYGDIQKLFTRSTDLVAFCEDRVLKILGNKDALFNADGNPQLVSTNAVLGQAVPFVGDYGISRNPESFAKDAYRAYFTDKQRGAVLRLSRDGLTPISNVGMKNYFRDNLIKCDFLIGTFDTVNGEYNLSLIGRDGITFDHLTASFNEGSKGWVSFKSFILEQGVSLSNNYYTFKGGGAYKHDSEAVERTVFYNEDPAGSYITAILNEAPSVVKNFNTLNYEGSQAKITALNNYNYAVDVDGWSIDYIKTDKQEGSVKEFLEKEGKWFNYIRGKTTVDTSALTFQGLGIAKTIV